MQKNQPVQWLFAHRNRHRHLFGHWRSSGYGVIGNARNAEKLSALEKELEQKAFACHWMN